MISIDHHLSDGEVVAFRDGELVGRRDHVEECVFCRVRVREARVRIAHLRDPETAPISHPAALDLAAYAEALGNPKRLMLLRNSLGIGQHLHDCAECRTIVETAPLPRDVETDVEVTDADAVSSQSARSMMSLLSRPSPSRTDARDSETPTSDDAPWSSASRRFARGEELFGLREDRPHFRSMPSRSQTRSEAARGETLVLGALQVWGQKAACTFAYLPTDGLAEERILATKTPRWWEYSKSFHLKVADIWGARSAGRRASADWRIPNRAAPLGAMQVQDNGAELGLGWAGWLRVVARPADAGVTLVFELPAALATCPLRVDYGAAHLFEEAEEVLQITLPPGRHVFRAMDPSRENGVLIELNLEIRLDTAV